MKNNLVFVVVAAIGLFFAGVVHSGELNLYNWGNYTSPDLIKKFEGKFNVKVTITDYDSNTTALAKVKAGGHGFDIVVPSANYVKVFLEEGLALDTVCQVDPSMNYLLNCEVNPSFTSDTSSMICRSARAVWAALPPIRPSDHAAPCRTMWFSSFSIALNAGTASATRNVPSASAARRRTSTASSASSPIRASWLRNWFT